MHVIEPIPFIHHTPGEDNMRMLTEDNSESQEKVDDMLSGYEKKGKDQDVEVQKEVTNGNVAEEIIRASTQFDIIIIGTLGRNALASLLLGSTAEKVARHACCPVMLVREIGTECKI